MKRTMNDRFWFLLMVAFVTLALIVTGCSTAGAGEQDAAPAETTADEHEGEEEGEHADEHEGEEEGEHHDDHEDESTMMNMIMVKALRQKCLCCQKLKPPHWMELHCAWLPPPASLVML